MDYAEMLPEGLFEEAEGGIGVTVAVVDTGVPSSVPCGVSDNFTRETPDDLDGHATFIGSILFGGPGIGGVCPNAHPCFVKAIAGGVAQPEAVARAIGFAVESGARVVNLSLGFPREAGCPECVRKACADAVAKGVTLVAAAGNDGDRAGWPAALESVVCVGSGDYGGRSVFSCRGDVDFVAPGVDLEGLSVSGGVERRSGTSFSAAIVSGMAALVIARGLRYGRVLQPSEVKKWLMAMCTDVGDPGWDSGTGYGLVTRLGSLKLEDAFFDRSTIGLVFDRIVSYVKSIIARS